MLAMQLVSSVLSVVSTLVALLGGALVSLVLVHVAIYVWDQHNLKHYPGPWLARLSDVWLFKLAIAGHRSEIVHEMHQRYGPVMRIAPNHISFSSPEALPAVYGHGNGTLKSDFYDTFTSVNASIFSTRDRAEHARKRKVMSHSFSPRSILDLTPKIQTHVGELVQRWEGIVCAEEGGEGDDGEGWRKRGGVVWINLRAWTGYFAFDVIGDLAYSHPFGMIKSGRDEALVPVLPTNNILDKSTKAGDSVPIEHTAIPAVQSLYSRAEIASVLGVLPKWLRPLCQKLIPSLAALKREGMQFAGIAVLAVSKRLASQANGEPVDYYNDLLAKVQKGRDENGLPLAPRELASEALTLLVGGSDTVTNTSSATLYHLARTPHAQKRLQEELDAVLGSPSANYSPIDQSRFRHMPYLEACVNEGLRIHSTAAPGLPRVVPPGGLRVKVNGKEHYFAEGSVVSVPAYSANRDVETWGANVEEYRPERWFEGGEEGRSKREKAYFPFSLGPRACLGRNMALLELRMLIASLAHRFKFEPGPPMDTFESVNRKPVNCHVGIKRRV